MSSLAKLRKKRGLRQSDLARLVGVHEGTVRHWEAGRQWPEKPHLDSLAKALGVKVTDLLVDQ